MIKIIQGMLPTNRIELLDNIELLKGITIHDTGNTGPGTGAEWHGRYLRTSHAIGRGVSWHFSVDDKMAVQHLPLSKQGRHAGNTRGNATTIGIEICVNPDGDSVQAHTNGAMLAAKILKMCDLEFSAETIKQHYDWSRKNCPAGLRSGNPFSWNEFFEKVKGFYIASGIINSARDAVPFVGPEETNIEKT